MTQSNRAVLAFTLAWALVTGVGYSVMSEKRRQ